MNATAETLPVARTPAHRTHRFALLLRREFWEHKGGFLWAPLVAAGITLLFTILAAIGGSMLKFKHGNDIEIPKEDIGEIARVLGAVGDSALLGGVILCMIVLGFVVFFYSLGCLYDDRKDRSVLFWKSLPVSDASSVASKVAWALVLAPLLAVGIGLALGLALWVIAAFTTTINGLPGASALFTHSNPLRIIGNLLAMLPLYVLWALPAVGWLMLCSAWARNKPFLWAVMIPVLGCALVSFSSLILGMDLDLDGLWYSTAYRGLLSVFPGTWLPTLENLQALQIHEPEDISHIVMAQQSWRLATSADLWIGAAAGVAMLVLATRLRRWRDEG